MISNPIIHKEVLSSLRTKKAVAMQGMFLLVMVGLVWLLVRAARPRAPGSAVRHGSGVATA